MTQNVGYEKNHPLSNVWDIDKIMGQLNSQINNKIVVVEIDGHIYHLKNSYKSVYDLSNRLADQIYEVIWQSDTDISENVGFKASNIKIIKDHLFYAERELDKYPPTEYKIFDANLSQAVAWKRLETANQDKLDIIWSKH